MIATRNPSSLNGILGCGLYSSGLAWTSAVRLVVHGYTGFLCLGKASKDALAAMELGMGWGWVAGCGLVHTQAQLGLRASSPWHTSYPEGVSIQHTRKQA